MDVEIMMDAETLIDLTDYFKSIVGKDMRYKISDKTKGRFCVISVDEEQKQAWIVAMNDKDGAWIGRYRVNVGHAISHNHIFNQLARRCQSFDDIVAEIFSPIFKPQR
jgi:hypothetical protein